MTPSRRRTVRAAVLCGPRELELRDFAVPTVADDEATLAVELCGICGTDLKYYSGSLDTPYPLIPGHEVVGRIADIGPRAAERYRVSVGDRVLVESSIPCWTCQACRSGAYRLCPSKGGYGTRLPVTVEPGLWGGMAELMFLASGSIVHGLPDTIPPRTAVAIPLLANGLQWLVRKGGLGPGERVLVQGCGPQGLAAAIVAREAGAREITVTGLRSDAARLAFAERLGARAVAVEPGWPRDTLLERLGSGYDVVLDVSGSPAAISSAPAHLRPQGTFVIAGLAGRGAATSFVTDELVWREIRVQGVLSKDESAVVAARAIVEKDERVADEAGSLVTHVFPLRDASAAITASERRLEGFVKAAIEPG